VKIPPLPLRLGLAACSSLLLLAGCGASDTGSGAGQPAATPTVAQLGSAASGRTSVSGNCATHVAPRTDSFHQAVSLTTTTADGLKYGDIVPGTGAAAATGQHITMQYTGWLQDGSSFDSSRNPGRSPFEFTLGNGEVIKGWDEGVPGMKLGGVRRLVIPAALAYGAAGRPPVIPANATLTFDVQLLCIA
jgi:FKBP-type peptidyl-prolyl cis-trans isomerase FkpA